MLAERTMRVVVGVLVVSSLATGVVLATASEPTVDWWVIGAGGDAGTAGSIWLGGTAGQWVSGSDTIAASRLDAGFWGGTLRAHRAFMPVVLRQA
jgi:hypothetical protein